MQILRKQKLLKKYHLKSNTFFSTDNMMMRWTLGPWDESGVGVIVYVLCWQEDVLKSRAGEMFSGGVRAVHGARRTGKRRAVRGTLEKWRLNAVDWRSGGHEFKPQDGQSAPGGSSSKTVTTQHKLKPEAV